MHKRTMLVALVLAALAAVVAASAMATTGRKASTKVSTTVAVEVFSPRAGDVAGKESKGFFVDLALPCSECTEPRQPLQPDRLHEPEDERDLGLT